LCSHQQQQHHHGKSSQLLVREISQLPDRETGIFGEEEMGFRGRG
jgi:hypothetical protein